MGMAEFPPRTELKYDLSYTSKNGGDFFFGKDRSCIFDNPFNRGKYEFRVTSNIFVVVVVVVVLDISQTYAFLNATAGKKIKVSKKLQQKIGQVALWSNPLCVGLYMWDEVLPSSIEIKISYILQGSRH